MNVVVIGAGLAGTLICNALAKKCRVTLLEAGEKDAISVPPICFIQKKFASVKTFCLGGGGTTNLWHNGLIPISIEDINTPVFKKVLEAISPYVDKAAANLYWLHNPYWFQYEKRVLEAKIVAEKIGGFSDGIDCLLYPKKFAKLKPVDGVHAFYGVSRIDFCAMDKRITTVHYTVNGERLCVDADVVILCAGCLGSPRMVEEILAAIGCADGKGGQGLADHPLGFVGKVRVKKRFSRQIRHLALSDHGTYECRSAIRVKSDCGKYTGCAFLRPAFTMENSLSIYQYKSLLGAAGGLDRIRHIFSLKLFHPDILAEIFSHLTGIGIPGRTYNVLFLFEQKRGRNHVRYNGSKLEVNWQITKDELRIYRAMIEKLHGMLVGVADEINLKVDITDDWLWSAAHHSGTISMGEKDDDLVDADLKLKKMDNVFVCDGSVIQEHSYANTGLTIASLAMRLAESVCCE